MGFSKREIANALRSLATEEEHPKKPQNRIIPKNDSVKKDDQKKTVPVRDVQRKDEVPKKGKFPTKTAPKQPRPEPEIKNPADKKIPSLTPDITEDQFKKLVAYQLRRAPNRQIVQAWTALSHGRVSSYVRVNLGLAIGAKTVGLWKLAIDERRVSPEMLIGLWSNYDKIKSILGLEEIF